MLPKVAEDIRNYLLSRYRDNAIARVLSGAIGDQVDLLKEAAYAVLYRFCVGTADEYGVVQWEKELGLVPPVDASLELRKALIKAKLLRPPTMTPEQIEAIANCFLRNEKATVMELPLSYAFVIQVPLSAEVWLPELKQAIYESRPAHLDFAVVAMPERILLLNAGGGVQAETIDLSYVERRQYVVFTDGRLNAAGNVATTVVDTGWNEVVRQPVYVGDRLNARQRAGSMRLNNAPLVVRTETVRHPGTKKESRFVGMGYALNAIGRTTSVMVDAGYDKLVTEFLFAGGLVNKGKIVTNVQTVTQDRPGTKVVFQGTRLNGKAVFRLNNAQSQVVVTNTPETKSVRTNGFAGPAFVLCGPQGLNNAQSVTVQSIVHVPEWKELVKREDGHVINCVKSRKETLEIPHPKYEVRKKYNPNVGMLLNSKPSLGYIKL
ncbi:hypothetical protein SCACP_30080 [Sporomusa carbonis]|uniref:putative phage tail protein n=1 Tax=Sporomusa carbonis TaxID=3076075 RepID=UPI003A5E1FC1